MNAETALWLQCESPRPEAGVRLVCFPHAGGSASFFGGWSDGLPGVEVHAVNYPGRGKRIEEAVPTDLRRLAAEVAAAIEPLAHKPLALFGHSMGAAAALETARELEHRGVRLAHLFASGSRDADLPAPEPADEDPDAVAERLVRLGGTDPELAADPMFRELVLPYVISDGRMFHAYTMSPGPVLCCPVTTIVGDQDAEADRRPWRRLTSGGFRKEHVPGNHFYLVADPPFELLASTLTETPPAASTAPSEIQEEAAP